MRVAVAQLDPVVGDFHANVRKIRAAYERSCEAGVDCLITPELVVCGYPPHDLVERAEIFERNEAALAELAALTTKTKTALVVGHIDQNPVESGRAARNCVSVLEGGKRVFTQAKTLLPTYDVFDEARYFEPAVQVRLWEFRGRKIALAICEDLWGADPALGRQIYGRSPAQAYAEQGADLIISISASPYEWGKRARRETVHADVARAVGVPVCLVNQVGATDEILFDGGSFLLNADGSLAGRLAFFRPAFAIADVGDQSGAPVKWEAEAGKSNGKKDQKPAQSEDREDVAPPELELLHRALVSGIRSYFSRTGFKAAVLGLSGGVDSALVAVLAAQALGSENVLAVAMPSQYSSSHSLADAEELAQSLGIRLEVRPIKFSFSLLSRELSQGFGFGAANVTLQPLALENLQARLRGITLMTLSNHLGSLVLTTGNKSELSVGYCTLYGDMVGALAPIADLFKTRVYELARDINRRHAKLIPERTLTRPPSAELRPDQTDQDSLPPYPELDSILEGYLEQGVPAAKLEARFPWVGDILKKVEASEYKRRQAAPGLKISAKAFGIGRRIPIAKRWEKS